MAVDILTDRVGVLAGTLVEDLFGEPQPTQGTLSGEPSSANSPKCSMVRSPMPAKTQSDRNGPPLTMFLKRWAIRSLSLGVPSDCRVSRQGWVIRTAVSHSLPASPVRISALWRLDPRRGLSTSTVWTDSSATGSDEVNESAVRLFITDRLNPRSQVNKTMRQ